MAAGYGMIAAAAIMAAAAGYSYYQQNQSNKTQYLLEQSSLELEKEQYRLQSQEKALSVASNFRQSLASQLALASQRGGAGSVARQFAGGALSALNKDLQAVQQGVSLNDLRTTQMLAQSRAGYAGRGAQNLASFGMNIGSAIGMGYQGYASLGGSSATAAGSAAQTSQITGGSKLG